MTKDVKSVADWAVWLSNCLVGLVFEYQTRGETPIRANVCSGFVLEIAGEWFLITAGHVHEIFEQHERGNIELLGVRCLDGFGSKPKTSEGFPFDLDALLSAFYYDKELGLDVAFVHLRPGYRNLLEANGIRVFTEENWQSSEEQSFDAYMLLGLLQESVIEDGSNWRVGSLVSVIEKCDTPAPCLVKDFQRFYGKIPPSNQFKSFVGMSGGPLLGFRKCDDGRLRYWIAGLQNGWHKETRTIAVGSIDTIKHAFGDWFLRQQESLESSGSA